MSTSDTEFAKLIACRKSITDAPRKDMSQDGAHRRNDFKCRAVNSDERFRVFMRQNVSFPENFSIGLVHLRDNGSELVLLRCNGPHGPVVNDPLSDAYRPHADFHIHEARKDNIENDLSPEAGANATTEYGTFDDALAYFVRRCGIEEAEKHFPALDNPTLFQGSVAWTT